MSNTSRLTFGPAAYPAPKSKTVLSISNMHVYSPEVTPAIAKAMAIIAEAYAKVAAAEAEETADAAEALATLAAAEREQEYAINSEVARLLQQELDDEASIDLIRMLRLDA
jgi:hypothetical protein